MIATNRFLEQLGAKITFKAPRHAGADGTELEFIGSDRLRRRIDDLSNGLGDGQPARRFFRH